MVKHESRQVTTEIREPCDTASSRKCVKIIKDKIIWISTLIVRGVARVSRGPNAAFGSVLLLNLVPRRRSMPGSSLILLAHRKACDSEIVCDIVDDEDDKAGVRQERDDESEADEDGGAFGGRLDEWLPVKPRYIQ